MNDIQHYQDKRVLNRKFYNEPEEPKNPSQLIKSFVCTCEVLPHSYCMCMSCKSISDEDAGNENLEIVRDGGTNHEEEVEDTLRYIDDDGDDIDDDDDDIDDDDDDIDDDEALEEEEEVDEDSEDLEGEEEEEDDDDDSEDLEGEEEDEFD